VTGVHSITGGGHDATLVLVVDDDPMVTPRRPLRRLSTLLFALQAALVLAIVIVAAVLGRRSRGSTSRHSAVARRH
jgi:hypothetical protein